MKILYFNYIEFVIGQAVDATFAKDLYEGYRIRFIDIKEILSVNIHTKYEYQFSE
ncbi:hypothetical protein GCM10023210_00160 [Chryseobacterium ginsengisoli]|uniref:Uncharacterized protein n=1 Tax=Chryseobacterium ginsengisoli TaxID=363853 RepID=A0ABP9LP46_9FLAO